MDPSVRIFAPVFGPLAARLGSSRVSVTGFLPWGRAHPFPVPIIGVSDADIIARPLPLCT